MYPRLEAPFAIRRAKSLKAIEAQLPDHFVFADLKNGRQELGSNDLYKVGTVANSLRDAKQPDGRRGCSSKGTARARITEFVKKDPYFEVAFEIFRTRGGKERASEALMYSAAND